MLNKTNKITFFLCLARKTCEIMTAVCRTDLPILLPCNMYPHFHTRAYDEVTNIT